MKNLLLTAGLILATTTSALAQLYVSPNATSSTDTFIYAKNVQLYVDGAIQLEKNSAGPTEASLYLRDEAQLFQGGASNANAGDGMISVFQEGIGDAFDYNAWTLPVSEASASVTGNRNFGEANFYHQQGTDLTNSSLATFIPGFNGTSNATTLEISDKWFYKWNIAGQNYVAINNSYDVPAGHGFVMKGTEITPQGVPETQEQRYDFRGRPNSGDITISLPAGAGSLSDGVGGFQDGNILVGNPYPSAMDLNVFFYDAANNGTTAKFNSIRFYDEDRTINSHLYEDNKAGFGIWTPGASQPDPTVGPYNPGNYTVPAFFNFDASGNPLTATGTSGPYVERRMAPIAQGFYIQSINAADTDITFKNSHRIFIKESDATYNSEFRTSISDSQIGATQIDPTDTQQAFFAPQIRINTYMGVSHMRQTLLILHDTATDDFDNGWDGLSPMDATSEMYFPLQTEFNDETKYPFVINAVPFDDVLKQIPFSLKIEEQMNVVITGIEEIDLPTDNIYVWDSLDNTYQNITGGESASFFLEEGTYDNRFYMVFRKKNSLNQYMTADGREVEEGEEEATTTVSFFQNNRQTQLEIANPDTMEIANAAIFDMRGRLVLNETNVGNASRFTFNTSTFSDGTYIVILTTKDNQTIDYKIIVENR